MEKIKQILETNKTNYDLIVNAKEPADKVIQFERFVVFSNGFMLCYSFDYQLVSTFYFHNMTGCKIEDKYIFFTFHSSKFSFATEKIKEVKENLIKTIPTLLSNNELHEKEMEPFNKLQSKPTLSSIITRMQCNAKYLNIKNIDDAIEKMTRIITFKETKVNFNEFKNISNCFSIILDVLPLCSFINSIVVPSSETFDPFEKLSEFLTKNKNVELFRFEGKVSDKFEKFLNNLKTNTTAKVQGITFDGSNFSSQILRTLSSCITLKEITSVGFKNAINDDAVNTFYNFFLSRPVSDKLRFLCIDSIPSVRVSTIILKLGVLSVLSITNCGLNIGKIFPLLKNTHLRTVDFSGNACTSSLSQIEIEPPSSLVHIIVNDITWGTSTITGFFKYIDKYFKGPLKISISQAEAQTEEWKDFFTNIKKIKFNNLRELIWNNNPVQSRLFEFLMRNKKLHSLSLNGCFHETDPEMIIPLTVFLSASKSLTKVVIESNENAYLGKFTIPVLTALQASNKITYLSINNAKCGNDGITQIKYLLKQSNSLETLHCDGLNPTNSQVYENLISTVLETKKKRTFNFFYPENDLEKLVSLNKISKKKLEEIKKSLMNQGFLYHGQCTLEFTEMVKNLSSLRTDISPHRTRTKRSRTLDGNEDIFTEITIRSGKKSDMLSKSKKAKNTQDPLFTDVNEGFTTADAVSFSKSITMDFKPRKRIKKRRSKRTSTSNFTANTLPTASGDENDFIYGTDVLDGSEEKSSKIKKKAKKENFDNPNWSFPFSGQYFIDIDFLWRRANYKFDLKKLENELKSSIPEDSPK